MPDRPERPPLRDLHPYRRCYACGGRRDLIEILHHATQARSWRCDDLIACARRVEVQERAA